MSLLTKTILVINSLSLFDYVRFPLIVRHTVVKNREIYYRSYVCVAYVPDRLTRDRIFKFLSLHTLSFLNDEESSIGM